MTRFASALILLCALSGWAAIGFAFADDAFDRPDRTTLEIVWRLARYFTNWVNLIVAMTFTLGLFRRSVLRAPWVGGVMLWIAIVGVVYHLLLARDGLTGLDFWADLASHTTSPILVVVYWLTSAPKAGLRFGHAMWWMTLPLVYLVYALARGLVGGRYPYFFVNPERVGWDGVALWSLGLCIAFVAAGCGVVTLGRVLAR